MSEPVTVSRDSEEDAQKDVPATTHTIPVTIEHREKDALAAAATATSHEQLADLEIHASDEVRAIIAKNPHTERGTLDHIARTYKADSLILQDVAQHKNAGAFMLEYLYNKANNAQRFGKIKNFFAPQESHGYQEIRLLVHIAGNANTPRRILDKLATNKWPSVRYSLANNPAYPVADRVAILRDMIAEPAPESPIKVSSGMMLDALDHPDIPESIRSKRLAEICADPHHVGLLETVANMKHLDLETVRILARNPREEVRDTIAKNPHLPEMGYNLLRYSGDFHVLELLAGNPGLPEDMLAGLTTETIEAFRQIAELKRYRALALSLAKNPSSTAEDLTRLSGGIEGISPAYIQKAVRNSADKAQWESQKALLEAPKVEAEEL
jgi:hypothetical protein